MIVSIQSEFFFFPEFTGRKVIKNMKKFSCDLIK